MSHFLNALSHKPWCLEEYINVSEFIHLIFSFSFFDDYTGIFIIKRTPFLCTMKIGLFTDEYDRTDSMDYTVDENQHCLIDDLRLTVLRGSQRGK